MALTREQRRARRRGWIRKAKAFWIKRGDEIEKWIDRIRSAAPDINQDGVVSDEEVARFVMKRAKQVIPDWEIRGVRVDSLTGGALYVFMRALLLLAKKKNIYEADLEEAAEDLNDENEDITDPD